MKTQFGWGIPVFMLAGIFSGALPARSQAAPPDPGYAPAPTNPGYAPLPPPPSDLSSALLEWTPPALAQLSAQAAAKSSFTLDRNLLVAAASLTNPDDATKQAIAKLDGVSVHLLNFGAPGMADPALIDSIRQAYHLRGWKHLVSSDSTGGPIRNGKADVWLVVDGTNVRGGVVLVESPKSLTLVTLAGNLSPTDLLHLRGHFGIPRFEGDRLRDSGSN
jgi:hypothetical protein